MVGGEPPYTADNRALRAGGFLCAAQRFRPDYQMRTHVVSSQPRLYADGSLTMTERKAYDEIYPQGQAWKPAQSRWRNDGPVGELFFSLESEWRGVTDEVPTYNGVYRSPVSDEPAGPPEHLAPRQGRARAAPDLGAAPQRHGGQHLRLSPGPG